MVYDWQRYNVSELIKKNKILIGDGYRAKNDELSTHGLPFARAGNINGEFLFENADCFPEENLPRVGNKVSQPGDVVFTSKGTVGRFGFVRPDTKQFVYSPQLCFWRSLDHEFLDPRFLYYWMLGREFKAQYKSVAGQTDMADYVSLTDQRRMHMTIPHISHQRAIAHILGTLDDKNELNRRMNETLESIARALFKSWFVDFDPVRAKMESRDTGLPKGIENLFPDEFEESELGEIPAQWEIRPLDKIADFLNGLALQNFPPEDDQWLPVIKISQLRSENVEGADRASSNIPREYMVDDGDVIFSWSGSLDVKIWCGGQGALNQHLFKVSSEDFPKWFYYLWIQHHLKEFQSIAADKATTMGHIQRHHLNEAITLVPQKSFINEMNKLISPLINKIVLLKIESRTLTVIRDTLLLKLISGHIRVE